MLSPHNTSALPDFSITIVIGMHVKRPRQDPVGSTPCLNSLYIYVLAPTH